MNTVIVENCKTLFIGRRGENEVTEVVFDFSEWQAEFGNGVIDLFVKRNGDSAAYPVVLSVDGTVATWLVSATDTNVADYGKAEYVYTVNGKIAKSAVFTFYVAEDIGQASGEAPDPYEDWIETLTGLGTETQLNAQAAEQSANDAAESAASAATSADQSEDSAEDAEAWAVGERNGEPVTEGDPTYNNNAKFWAGKAMTDAPVTSVNGKAGDIVLDLDDIPNGEQYARTTPAQIQQIGTNAADIADVEELIPAEASAGNQLADKYFVNNEIQTNSAHFRGAWPNWFAVPTDKNQYPADNGGVKTPSANDYIVVLDASGYPAGQTILSGTWRFSYVGSWEMSGRNGWKNEYQVNETALHTEQIAAINAKIPPQASASNQLADKILVNTKLMAYRTSADQDAIDSAQDGKINALTNLLNNKQSKITANGILKGNGNGGISAAVAGMDYLPTSALYAYRSANAQDAIDNAQDQNISKNTTALNTMQPAATAADIGKALIVKTVVDGKPTSYEYGEAGGGGSTLTAGDGIGITDDVISNTQGIEYIVGTQSAATSKWTGVSTDETLKVGKIIAYYLPFAGTSTAATLALTMADGTTTREISLQLKPNATVTTQFPAGSIIILVYDGTYWRVNASYDTDTNTYPTGYCVTNGSVAAKAAACSFGYRGDTNYFPCLFRYANTAADATLAITTYAPEAAPIYVNGARTSAENTFSAGVILFLYYNGAYYCYNDGRFPILVNGAVTSVQEYAAGLLVNYRTATAQDTIDAGKQAKITANGILKGDGAGGVSAAVAGTDYLTPSALEPYRTAANQDVIDDAQDERIDGLEQTTTATTIGPVALATFDASAADMPLKGLTVDIEPVQSGSGDPSPDNVRPITGWTGCNIYLAGKNLMPDIKTQDGNSRVMIGETNGLSSGNYSLFFRAGRYTLTLTRTNDVAFALFYIKKGGTQTNIAGSSSTGTKYNVVLAEDGWYHFCAYKSGGVSPSDMSDIELSLDASDYEPYHGNIYPITFPTSAGTVYGGTLLINADGSGELTVDAQIAQMDALTWNTETGRVVRFSCRISGMKRAATRSLNIICSCYKANIGGAFNDDFTIYNAANNELVYLYDSRYTTLAEFLPSLEGQYFVYPLQNPITYKITAEQVTTLLDTNNIWANCGDVSVTYGAYLETVKAYADKVGDSILSAIAPLEMDYTASRAYTVGSYLFVGAHFYKVTAAIASGDTINPGTNVTQTTVAEQLMALANI